MGCLGGHYCLSSHTDTDGALDKPLGQQVAGGQSYQFHFQSTGNPEGMVSGQMLSVLFTPLMR